MPKRPKETQPASRLRRANADGLKHEIAKQVCALGASVVGFAPVERWAAHDEVPDAYRPEAIWPSARTVVVFGVPMLLPVLESTPSINYQEMYDTSNRLLDDLGYRLATWLCERGHATVFLPRDGYGSLEVLLENRFGSFSHTYAAKYAGLGTVGLSRNLLTEKWGPRIRLGSVFMALALPGDKELTEDLCNLCGICERLCPTQAIRKRGGGIIGDLDKDACTRHHIELKKETRWPCGICAKVCPVGQDRRLFDSRSTKRYLEERSALEADPADRRYQGLVHLRRHGSRGSRIV
jgi:epoxyqueuosine reductase QueG